MKIVLLESLGIDKEELEKYTKVLENKGHEFVSYEKTSDHEILKEEVKDADVLILANMPLNGEIIKSAQNLKFINVAFTGLDHVDLNAAKERGICVKNASGYSTDAVAEIAMCMILSLLRNVSKVEKRAREGKTKDGLIGNELKGKRVGIIGTGKIGSRVAELCRAFGCETVGCNCFSNKPDTPQMKYLSLEELLKTSDIVTLHCPLTEKSKNLINEDTLKYMKKSAILINTARGGVVDSKALAKALNDEMIAGAGIDVLETEPPFDLSHALLNSKNTLLTPHVAFAAKESMIKRAKIVFENLNNWLENA